MLSFSTLVLEPLRVLRRQSRLLQLLYEVGQFVGGFEPVQDYEQLRALYSELHRLLWTLYPHSCKPKAHYVYHIIDMMQQLNTTISCFPSERRHRIAKSIGSYAFRAYTTTMLRRSMHLTLQRYKDYSFAFSATCLLGPTLQRDSTRGLGRCTSQLRTKAGTFTTRDFVAFGTGGARVALGQVLLCFDNAGDFGAEVQLYNNQGEHAWARTHRRIIVPAERLLKPVAAVVEDEARVFIWDM
jgi:hypothetical protein